MSIWVEPENEPGRFLGGESEGREGGVSEEKEEKGEKEGKGEETGEEGGEEPEEEEEEEEAGKCEGVWRIKSDWDRFFFMGPPSLSGVSACCSSFSPEKKMDEKNRETTFFSWESD